MLQQYSTYTTEQQYYSSSTAVDYSFCYTHSKQQQCKERLGSEPSLGFSGLFARPQAMGFAPICLGETATFKFSILFLESMHLGIISLHITLAHPSFRGKQS